MVQRVSTGIEGLDEVLQGGFPKGSMILLGGNPGTGKTIFSGEFLYNGARGFFENGLYVSFSEGREAFISNMSSLGLDFETLEHENRFKILDLVTVKETGLDTLMEMITSDIDTLGVERLVIDSFTAMANAFEKPIDVRIALHLLSKIVRQSGCTTIVITEIPTGGQEIGLGIEEFVADGIIVLKKMWGEERFLRELNIEKMRGTMMMDTRFLFTLHNGFKVFQPFDLKPVKERRKYVPLPRQEETLSTGSAELDRIIGGGLPKGSATLLEFGKDIPRVALTLLFAPILSNSFSQGLPNIILPPSGEDAESLYRTAKLLLFTDEEINDLLRVIESSKAYVRREIKYIFTPKAQNSTEQYREIMDLQQELKKSTGNPLLKFIFLDAAEALFGRENIKNILDLMVADTRKERDFLIMAGRTGAGETAQSVANMADIRLRMVCEKGVLLFYGIRPRTPFYVVDVDASKGYRLPKLTPII